MSTTEQEIMEWADVYAHAKVTDATPHERLPRNVLQRKVQEEFSELRRLHAENESLRAGYDAARLEIASLQAQLEAIGAGGVEPLRKRCLHQISEPAQPVAWAIFAEDGGACMWTQIRQHAEATAKDVGLQVTPLYAAQAASVDATVQRDADRYRFLRDGEWRRTDLESVIRLQLNTLWDSKIDAAIAAQQGGA